MHEDLRLEAFHDGNLVVVDLRDHADLLDLTTTIRAAAPIPVIVVTDDEDLQVGAIHAGAIDAVPAGDPEALRRAGRLAPARVAGDGVLPTDVRIPRAEDALMILDESNRVIDANHRVTALLGWDVEDLRGRTPLWLLRDADREAFGAFLSGHATTAPRTIEVMRSDDRWSWMHVTVLHGGDGSRRYLVAEDVTAARAERDELRIRALTDPLTGLLNRGALIASMDAVLARTSIVSVLFCDLDDFKLINDTHGHLVGDAVLRWVASMLRDVAREGTDLVCRYAGDEFVVVLHETTSDQARVVARRITEALRQPVVVEGVEIDVSLSMGTSTGGGGTVGAVDLLRVADDDLYARKHARSPRRAAHHGTSSGRTPPS